MGVSTREDIYKAGVFGVGADYGGFCWGVLRYPIAGRFV